MMLQRRIFYLIQFVNIHKLNCLLILALVFTAVLQAQVWPLDQVIKHANTHNKSLVVAENKKGIAVEKEREVRSQTFPQLKLAADYRYYAELPYQLLPLSVFNGPEGQFKEAQFGVPHNASVGLSFSLPLFNPSRKAMSDVASAGSEVAGLQTLQSGDQLFYDLSVHYFNAQVLRNQLAFADSNLANSRKLLRVVSQLREQGLARQIDVDQARLQMEQVSTQRDLAEGSYRQIINTIRWLAGIEQDTPLEAELQPEFDNPIPESDESSLERKIADARIRMVRAEWDALKRTRLPNVVATAQLNGVGLGYTGEPESFWKSYLHAYGGIQLQWPIYQGGRTNYQERQKYLEMENVLLERDMLSDKLSMQRTNIIIQMDSRRKAAGLALDRITQGQAVYEQMLALQAQGMASVPDVLQADNALREMQHAYLSATVSYLAAVLDWKKINGRLSPDSEQPNSK
jgi:outer membrane protein TolC